jgi:diketogulonate reductase-like aldo/keto reductase
MGTGPNDRGLSAYHIRKACEDSLRRLGTDHIDLYQMHHVDRSTPWEEIWQAMEQLVTAGKVVYLGSSNFAGWHIATAQGVAASRHFMGLVSEQSLYNLSARTIELEVIPALRHFGLGLIPYSPLGGLLGGALQKAGQGRRADDRMQQRIQQLRPQLEAYEELCRELGETPADVALAWLLHQPAVTATIVGPRTAEQLARSLRARRSLWARRRCAGSTRSGPARAARPRRRTPGESLFPASAAITPAELSRRHRSRALSRSVEQRGEPAGGPASRLTLEDKAGLVFPTSSRWGRAGSSPAPTIPSAGPPPRWPSGTCGSTTSTSRDR